MRAGFGPWVPILALAMAALAGCAGDRSPAGQPSTSASPTSSASPGESYRLVTVFAHLTDRSPATPPEPDPHGGHGDCGPGESLAWRSDDVWTSWPWDPPLDPGNLSLLAFAETSFGPDEGCGPFGSGGNATAGDRLTLRWSPAGAPPLNLTRTADGVRVEGDVEVPNGQDRDLTAGETGLYFVDFTGSNGHRYTGSIWVHDHGLKPRDRLHVEPFRWLLCCPPGAGPAGDYWVMKVSGTLHRDPPPSAPQANCGRPVAARAGVDERIQRLELVDGATDFQPGTTAAVTWDEVTVEGQACQIPWMKAFPATSFQFRHALPGGASIEWEVALGDNATVDGHAVAPGGTVQLPVDETAGGIRTSGTLNVTALGPWKAAGVRFVADEGAVVADGGYWLRG